MDNIIYLEEKIDMTDVPRIQNQVIKLTPEVFSKEVTALVWKDDISYLEAIVHLMNEKQLEPEYVAKLLTKEVKAELEIEAQDNNLVEKSEVNRLF